MAAHLDPHAQPLGDASDMELVEYTRAGNSAAFGELWVRHSNAGRAVARSHRFDADDLLSEAFARVFQAISAGGGPTAAFRPYLFTTIRNVSMQWARAKSADASEDLDLIADPSTEEDASLAALDRSLTVNAFRSLPTRWQEALWYSEVEQLSSAEIAPLLGMKANAVSALTYRAREGLRQAWIQAHLQRTTDPECAAAIERLGSFTRGMLGTRESKRVRDHLSGCTACTIVADEARQVGSRLALVLLPLAAGVSGAVGFLSWLQAGSGAAGGMVAATAMPAHLSTTAAVSSASASSASASRRSASKSTSGTTGATAAGAVGLGAAGIVGTAVGALALAAAVVAAVTLGPALFSPRADEATTSAEISADDDSGADDSGDSAAVADPAPGPAATPTPSPTQAPPETPVPTPESTRSSTPTNPTKPAIVPEPAATDAPAPTDPTAQPTTPPTTPPVEPTEPPVEPEPTPAAPTFTVDQAADQLTFPLFSGTAEPLSTVRIVDADGNSLASTTAAADGSWSISDFGSSVTGGAPGRQVFVQQVVGGVASELSAPEQLVVLDPPTIESPLDGASIAQGSSYEIAIAGSPGASIQRIVNGAVREDIHALDGSGMWSQIYGAPDAGPIELGMRYYDPATGRFGLTRTISYTIG